MRLSAIGDSVEGNGLELQCRKFHLQGPIKSKLANRLVYTFKLSIHGFARVSKVLPDSTTKISEDSLINEGDEIHGETINGFSSKAPGRPKLQHATSTHKASFVATHGHSYASVEIGVRDQLQAISFERN